MRCNGAFLRLNLQRLFSDTAFLVLLFAFGAAAILPLTVEYIDDLPRIGSQHLLDYCFFSLAGMGAALGIFAPIWIHRCKEEYAQLRFPVYLFNLLMISLAALFFFLAFFIVYLLTALLFSFVYPAAVWWYPAFDFFKCLPVAICNMLSWAALATLLSSLFHKRSVAIPLNLCTVAALFAAAIPVQSGLRVPESTEISLQLQRKLDFLNFLEDFLPGSLSVSLIDMDVFTVKMMWQMMGRSLLFTACVIALGLLVTRYQSNTKKPC